MKTGHAAVSLIAGLAAVNAVAWLWAWMSFSDRPTLLGIALLAWVFGLRHAVDADHIAAIDNVVRKLMHDGGRPMTVGLWFSLGHSTVVILACIAVAVAASAMQGSLEGARVIGGAIGTSLSAAFLIAIALINLGILRDVWRRFRRARLGVAPAEEDLFATGGLFARLLRPVLRGVRSGWHMYPLGFLFGLGFDTATEIGLLGISATQAAQGLSSWQILIFPALFTAGMALVDTADSVLMVGAYGWAFLNPIRKLWYNLTITAISVVVAVLIGGIEALGLIVDKLKLEGPFWYRISGLNESLANFGYLVVGVFLASWVLSFLIYRWQGLERPIASQ